ncbi:MAG: hypothetical protein M0Z41_01560 [Peptococcaceae bacterium]|nr:hypothetical protein [Peptococcaceae bacterium]
MLRIGRITRDNGDQRRVLNIAKRFHLNKEEVRELVDEWLRADEKGKVRLAQGLRSKCPAGGPKPGTLANREAVAYARRQLYSCQQTLGGLLELVGEPPSPVADWRPSLPWRKLVGTFEDLTFKLGGLTK